MQRWFSESTRASVSAEAFATTIEWAFDLSPMLSGLSIPTLILHRKHSQVSDLAQARSVAALIVDARLVALDGDAGALYWDREQLIATVYEFLEVGGETRAASTPSGTAVILFADIVDSTALTERMGDAAFRERARALDASLRSIISGAGGTAIDGKLLGDGVLATFAAASQAIDAALRCAAAGNGGDLPLHLGIHAGDVIREENNVFGGAVNIASRISGLSMPGEVLVSDVVRGLARTSAGVTFEDQGERALKGVADPPRVFAVRRHE
jgi:class 3 adenylate cyclase